MVPSSSNPTAFVSGDGGVGVGDEVVGVVVVVGVEVVGDVVGDEVVSGSGRFLKHRDETPQSPSVTTASIAGKV